MRLYELACSCYVYAGFTDFDKTYRNFLQKTTPALDMQNVSHRKALLEWLNEFGCRQFERSFHKKASQYLGLWYEKNKHLLPPLSKTLLDLSDSELDNARVAYNSLMNVEASATKSVGPTGTAKILFTLRKDAFPPWDGAIRKSKYDGSGASYKKFLIDTREALHQLGIECKKHGIMLSDLPNVLNRESSSLVKLIDEYNWVVVTRDCQPLSVDKLEEWYKWVK